MYRKIAFVFKGLREFTRNGHDKAARSFTPTALEPDITARSFIVTGANSGLGKQVTLDLAKRGASVHMLCRNKERGEEAQREIRETSGNEKIYLHLADMSDLDSIVKFSQDFQESGHAVHVLVIVFDSLFFFLYLIYWKINNAGVMLGNKELTVKGYEKTFATNTLGTYLLTKLMLPCMEKVEDPRVVIVSSGGMLTQKLDGKDLQFDRMTPFEGTVAYAQTKRQQVVMAHHLAQKNTVGTGVRFYSMHPGWADTPGVKTSMPAFYDRFHEKFRSVEQGADTIIWLALSNEVPGDGNGCFYCDRHKVPEHIPLAWTKSTAQEETAFINSIETMIKEYLP